MTELLDKFRTLDLSRYPQDDVESILGKIKGLIPIYETTLPVGKVVYRARPNDNTIFCQRKHLSYKPQEYNKTYQRASTPHNTMFYGATVLTEDLEYELDDARIAALYETSYVLRNPSHYPDGEQKLTYGKWRLQSDCKLGTIVFSDVARNVTPSAKCKSREFLDWLKSNYPNYTEQAKLLIDFFAEEYAKESIKGNEDFKYMISASFSELLIHLGLDGVLFPSVRTNLKGMNVAIAPDFVNSSMRLEGICECTVHKKDGKVFINNERMAHTNIGDQSFNLEEIGDSITRASTSTIKEILEAQE